MKKKSGELFERAKASENSEGTANAVRSIQPPSTQMPNYELKFKFYTNIVLCEHIALTSFHAVLATTNTSSSEPKNPQPSYSNCTASPTTDLFGLVGMQVAGQIKKQLVGLASSSKLST